MGKALVILSGTACVGTCEVSQLSSITGSMSQFGPARPTLNSGILSIEAKIYVHEGEGEGGHGGGAFYRRVGGFTVEAE